MPLNGASALTEGARLRKLTGALTSFIPRQGNTDVCIFKESIQYPITQTQNSKIVYDSKVNAGHALNGGGVTQERARAVLARQQVRQFGSEGVLIASIQQKLYNCSSDTVPRGPIVSELCPPTPAPPAPPMRECIPTKNLKIGS